LYTPAVFPARHFDLASLWCGKCLKTMLQQVLVSGKEELPQSKPELDEFKEV